MNHCGVDVKAAASPNGKRIETVKAEMPDLTQDVYEDLHKESSSKEDAYFFPPRKSSKRRR